jgi:hypothetical protein
MMNLKRPFLDQKSLDHFQENVWVNSGPQVRPSVPKKLASNIKKLLERSWDSNLKVRPSAAQFENALRVECLILRKDMPVSHNERRSTYLLVRGKGETINQSARSMDAHLLYDNEECSAGSSESQEIHPFRSFRKNLTGSFRKKLSKPFDASLRRTRP